ncbi:MAG: CidA/LrgA family protein [Muribaculaceae bacterium]|nr:CidA/LrgA family protein [Muribaculaceae bacterium]
MILQFGLILAFLALGELVVWLTGIPVPSSILGMLLLTFSLHKGIVKPRHVEKLSNFLVHNLGFFFVPAGVGLMNCLGLISEQWLPIVVSATGSTVVIIAVTGWVHKLVRKSVSGRHRAKEILKEDID